MRASELLLCWGLCFPSLLVLLAPSAYADVYIMTANYNLDPQPDLPADFGPEIPDVGLEGYLRIADPEDACQPFTFQDFGTSWVALISRQQQFRSTNCTFDIKVMNAQQAGAMAAIVYDDVYESLIIMSKPKGHDDPDIPSVFVSQRAGIIMKKLLTLDVIRVRLTPVTAVAWMSMVMSAFLGLLALSVVLATFYVMRSWSAWLGSQQTRHGHTGPQGAAAAAAGHRLGSLDTGLSPRTLRALPVVIHEQGSRGSEPSTPHKPVHSEAEMQDADESWDKASRSSSEHDLHLHGVHAGETKRVCTICLENYLDGEKIRVLPCQHRFHMGCVDQWLSNRRFCPVCKHDASKPLPGATPPLNEASSASGVATVLSGWQLVVQGLRTLVGPSEWMMPVRAARTANNSNGRQRNPWFFSPRPEPALQEPLIALEADVETGPAHDLVSHRVDGSNSGPVGAAAAVAAEPARLRVDASSSQPIEIRSPGPAAGGQQQQHTAVVAGSSSEISIADEAAAVGPSNSRAGAARPSSRASNFPSTA